MKYITWSFKEECSKIAPFVKSLIQDSTTEKEKAKKIHDFVQNQILFGFTPQFDLASPSYTLQVKKGHCNPKASLINTMLHVAGIKSRIKIIHINLDPLLFNKTGMNPGVHCYTEIQYSGTESWIPVDSYVVDKKLFYSSIERLKKENKRQGYFTHVEAQVEWDGESKCMSQYANEEIRVDDFLRTYTVDNLEDFYSSKEHSGTQAFINSLPWWSFFDSVKENFLFKELNTTAESLREV